MPDCSLMELVAPTLEDRDIRLTLGISRVRSRYTYMKDYGMKLLMADEDDVTTVMDRDRRLTGFFRGQTDNVKAPPGFEVSNPWKVGFPESCELVEMSAE